MKLFEKVDYSEAGSNNRKKRIHFSLFIDYLDECEKCKCHDSCKIQSSQYIVIIDSDVLIIL